MHIKLTAQQKSIFGLSLPTTGEDTDDLDFDSLNPADDAGLRGIQADGQEEEMKDPD